MASAGVCLGFGLIFAADASLAGMILLPPLVALRPAIIVTNSPAPSITTFSSIFIPKIQSGLSPSRVAQGTSTPMTSPMTVPKLPGSLVVSLIAEIPVLRPSKAAPLAVLSTPDPIFAAVPTLPSVPVTGPAAVRNGIRLDDVSLIIF